MEGERIGREKGRVGVCALVGISVADRRASMRVSLRKIR